MDASCPAQSGDNSAIAPDKDECADRRIRCTSHAGHRTAGTFCGLAVPPRRMAGCGQQCQVSMLEASQIWNDGAFHFPGTQVVF
jgi:hypothetical protein